MNQHSELEIRDGYGAQDWEFELAGHLIGTIWKTDVDGEFTITRIEPKQRIVGDKEFYIPVLWVDNSNTAVWTPSGIHQEFPVRKFQRRFDLTLDHQTILPVCDTANRIAAIYQEVSTED